MKFSIHNRTRKSRASIMLKNVFPYLVVSLFLGVILWSCTDELGVKTETLDPDDSTLLIYVPNVTAAAEYGASRARSDYNAGKDLTEEATINNLWFFAFPVDESANSATKKVAEISNGQKNVGFVGQNSSNDNTSNYTTYTVENMTQGKYHIYLLANFEGYVQLNSSSTYQDYFNSLDEDEVKDLILNFSAENYLGVSNLPMACLHHELKKTDGNTPMGDEAVTFNSDNKTVYADLTFQCAKVRYTILFDKSSTVFSKEFSSTDVDFDKEVATENVMSSTKLVGGSAFSPIKDKSITALLKRATYPSEGSQFLKDALTEYESDLDEVQTWVSQDQKAWQGIQYFPENTNDGEYRTKLKFKAKGSEVKEEYSITLFDNNVKLERGKFYDVVARLTKPETMEFNTIVSVQPWTTQSLTYTLHGPYELIVEKSTIDIETGKTTTFWYKSDVAPGDINFSYPTLNGEAIYKAEVYKDDEGNYILTEDLKYQIAVKVSPKIPVKDYDLMKDGNGEFLPEYKYLEIIAGNIHKKIDVNNLTLEAYLNVTPEIITIDLREMLASGLNDNQIKIEYETNVTDKTISIEDPGGLFTGIEDVLKINPKISGQISGNGQSWTTSNGSYNIGEFSLDINGIMSGKTFWQNAHRFNLKFSVEGVSEARTVTIEVKPYTSDYIIHFKYADVDDTWLAPHIYVYQCLEVPADAQDCFIVDSTESYAGKTVGYRKNEKNDDGSDNWDNAYAALEYCFTNDFGFKGWQDYGGSIPYKTENPYNWLGFVILSKSKSSFSGQEYSPEDYSTGYYNYEMNLNTGHLSNKDNWLSDVCSYCNQGWYKAQQSDGGYRSWPGIAMQPEYDEKGKETGWWKYILSGVATPGKAMIMFADTHGGRGDNEKRYRYPLHSEVGVPLFDFPSHEGWFLYNSAAKVNGFQSSEPASKPMPDQKKIFKKDETIKINWNKNGNDNYYCIYLYVENPFEESRSWPGYKGWQDNEFISTNEDNLSLKYTIPHNCTSVFIIVNNGLDEGNGQMKREYEIKIGDSNLTRLTSGDATYEYNVVY